MADLRWQMQRLFFGRPETDSRIVCVFFYYVRTYAAGAAAISQLCCALDIYIYVYI